MTALTHLPLLLPLLFAVPAKLPDPAPATSSSPAAVAQEPEGSWDVPVAIFTPKYSSPYELAQTCERLFIEGLVSEDAQSRNVRFVPLDSAIVVSGPNPHMARALELLGQLDETARSESRVQALRVREYALKHLTMEDARVALRPLFRQIQQTDQAYVIGMAVSSDNISFIQTRGAIVVRDTDERIEEIFALLERLDVPRQQVLLRSYLIRGVDGGNDPRVPTEVTESLKQLVPYEQFELVSFAMVRSDVTADMGMTDATASAEYRMQFDPGTYDVESRRLNFASCRFDITRIDGTARVTRQFATSASLTADEYTVLGGVGADADFLVLHMSLIDG
ncbi:MAG: hypothetical protein H6831_02725 [Planctomycetes bacterium]|nr:hypothetical protein [Planctomycetota bacterium]MCB9903298.1 hypothetical protein [Planctomycetota bacterium]